MTVTVNELKKKIPPVICNFWWKVNEDAELSYEIEGETYPYKHQKDDVTRSSDARYKVYKTPIQSSVEFSAVKTDRPKVITPEGITILEYFWEFGDGTTGYGPTLDHEFLLPVSSIETVLRVTDSRQREWYCSKIMNLANFEFVGIISYKIRVAPSS